MCLSTAGLLELLLDEIVELDDKKLSVKSALPIEKSYLSSIYNFIVQKQPVKFQKVIEYYSVTFTDRNINELLTAVGESLVQEGCAVREKGGIFGGKTVYIPDEKELMEWYRISGQNFWKRANSLIDIRIDGAPRKERGSYEIFLCL